MNDHSPNATLHAQSFMHGANADYIDQLQARYANDPASVEAGWAEFFRALGEAEVEAKRAAAGPSWARADWPPQPADDLTAAAKLIGSGALVTATATRQRRCGSPPGSRSPS